MALDLFPTLNALFNKTPLDIDPKDGSTYIILRFLASNPRYVELCAGLSAYSTVANTKMICTFLQEVLPKQKTFYAKNLFKQDNSVNTEVLKCIMNYLKCTESQAKEFIQILEHEGVDLFQYFGIPKAKPTKRRKK